MYSCNSSMKGGISILQIMYARRQLRKGKDEQHAAEENVPGPSFFDLSLPLPISASLPSVIPPS
jgi:hypothetical protein